MSSSLVISPRSYTKWRQKSGNRIEGAEPRDSWIVVGADVHYDLRQPDGTTRRVLFPSRFQPGALGIAVR